MLGSDKRILTTHAGSLPRPRELDAMLGQLSRREPVDRDELDMLSHEATQHAIEKQLEAGIDIGNNGEQSRESFFTHVQHRMSGFSGRSDRPLMRDIIRYRSFIDLKLPEFAKIKVDLLHAPKATGEVRYADTEPVNRECSEFLKIAAEQPTKFVESFMTSPSPGIVAAAMLNEHYSSLEQYIGALGEALRAEYEAIVSHGLILQIDGPDLAMERHTSFADRTLEEFLAFVRVVVKSINHALEKIPPDRVRMHVCWGNYEGPHNDDVPLQDLLPLFYEARVGALMISMANPRHEHEYRVFQNLPLPSKMNLIAGVIDTTTNYIEHPEVVADRIERAANAVGDPRRIIAGTDCGFATSAGLGEVAEEIVWEKLKAMAEGARIATRRLLR
jgi:5-methyltetrahydropteroyltriglutamate--homocysteine methyltransferase